MAKSLDWSTAMKGIDLTRDDQSRFIVHLTRDDRGTYTNGDTAEKNFISILKSKTIGAYKAHCLFSGHLDKMKKAERKPFYVSCFTETPISQLDKLVGPKSGRRVDLGQYGFVFRKEEFILKGGSPCIYANDYCGNNRQKSAWLALFDQWQSNPKLNRDLEQILPLVNVMHERHDFYWEREWRFLGPYPFLHKKLVAIIAPADRPENIQRALGTSGIAVISPGMSYEAIIDELASQKRMLKETYVKQMKAPVKTS